MIIDLESWEEGYRDGIVRRPFQCTPGLDRFSYSSGYFQASAYHRKGTPERLQPHDKLSADHHLNGSLDHWYCTARGAAADPSHLSRCGGGSSGAGAIW